MHNLVTHIIFGTLTLTVLIGFFIMIKNEIKIRKFSAIIKKKLIAQNLKKLVQLKSKLPEKVLHILPKPGLHIPNLNPKKEKISKAI